MRHMTSSGTRASDSNMTGRSAHRRRAGVVPLLRAVTGSLPMADLMPERDRSPRRTSSGATRPPTHVSGRPKPRQCGRPCAPRSVPGVVRSDVTERTTPGTLLGAHGLPHCLGFGLPLTWVGGRVAPLLVPRGLRSRSGIRSAIGRLPVTARSSGTTPALRRCADLPVILLSLARVPEDVICRIDPLHHERSVRVPGMQVRVILPHQDPVLGQDLFLGRRRGYAQDAVQVVVRRHCPRPPCPPGALPLPQGSVPVPLSQRRPWHRTPHSWRSGAAPVPRDPITSPREPNPAHTGGWPVRAPLLPPRHRRPPAWPRPRADCHCTSEPVRTPPWSRCAQTPGPAGQG